MLRRNRELWYALALVVMVTAAYVVVYRRTGALPEAVRLFGHGIGIVGFVLMLMTETLYSLRKLSSRARWGSMAAWLRIHMVTGIVGSYMVLLHPAMRFRGLAGVVALFTVIVVASGLVGRYLYTSVPRALDGSELEAAELERRIAEAETVMALEPSPAGAALVADRLAPTTSPSELDSLLHRRRALQRELEGLAGARRALSMWRAVHVPLTLLLFVAAFAHIIGAIYYATLQR
jgi:hypothetical protein